MTGRRAREKLRETADARFPGLWQFFGCSLHEDWPELNGSMDEAIARAIADRPVELRQQVRRELKDLLSEMSADGELRDMLNKGLGVNVRFRKPEDARAFAEEVAAKLERSIEEHFYDPWNARR
jgi:hypothetical protein